jgi:hypothetical protein
LEAACESILARRPAAEVSSARGRVFDDYTPGVQARIDSLCRSLIEAADALPVVHHATHVDGWSMAHDGLMALDWPDGRARAIATMGLGVAIYPASQADAFLAQAAKARRRRGAARLRARFWAWYPNAVATAFTAGQFFNVDYVVAVVTECLGGSREDYEIAASQSTLVPGIKPQRGDPALTKRFAQSARQRKVLTRKLQRCANLSLKTSSSGRARS